MLGQLFIFLYFITPSHLCLLSSLQVNCNPNEKPKVIYILNGEAFFAKCPLDAPGNTNNVTWFRNDSQTEMSSDSQARIHQDGKFLKFFPARLADAGFYSCVIRKEEKCFCAVIEVDVLLNDDGLCYNNKALYRYDPYLVPSLRIDCPCQLDSKSVEFQWFKDCKPLDLKSDTYITSTNTLAIKNATLQDSGNYTCLASITKNGTNYNISCSINYVIQEIKIKPKLYISYPTDNIIDVELGSSLNVSCKASFTEHVFLSWKYNDSSIMDYDSNRVREGQQEHIVTNDGKYFTTVNVTFSRVKEEDYGKTFQCEAIAMFGLSKAFFILKKTDPNYQGFLIVFFVTAAFIIITSIIINKIFKVDLVLWYRSSCFFHPKQSDGKVYDAYIMYPRKHVGNCSNDVDLFVLKLLPEVLEKQCNYRLFIIGRDDLPGQAMADLVDEAISQSRRLIIVLGQIFNETHIGEDFEQKIAMYDALLRNALKVILIEMEKITDYTFMPESIKYIRQKQGVVRWKGTFTEASLSPNTRFWKNVRYRMPPAPQHTEKDLEDISSERL